MGLITLLLWADLNQGQRLVKTNYVSDMRSAFDTSVDLCCLQARVSLVFFAVLFANRYLFVLQLRQDILSDK